MKRSAITQVEMCRLPFENPETYFRNIRKCLKDSGIAVVIDHKPSRGFSFVSLFKHFTPAEKIANTMESARFKLSDSSDFLEKQSFTIWALA